MNLTFYHVPMSTSNLTECVLAELGTPCERVRLSIAAGDTRKPEFLALNPNGRVPVIVHEGTPIWESAAITMYLGDVFGVDAHLYPAPGPKRGEAMKWIVWCNITLGEAGARWAASLPPGSEGAVEPGSRDWVPPEERSARAAEKAKAELVACLAILEGGLSGRSFLLGDYSLVDTHVHVLVGLFAFMGVDLTHFPGVAGWLQRCSERPALALMMAD
jgi:glutathione S-transferase